MYQMVCSVSGRGEGEAPGAAGIGKADEAGRSHFETAWRQHLPELFRRGLDWTSGRREDAEDALGQAAIVALQKMPRDLAPCEARGWLLRLVYSKCMDIHRQRRRARLVPREVDDPALEQELAAPEPSHESALLVAELAAMARELIRELPSRLRSVAELHFLQDMKYPEIADTLAISEVNVRKRIQHARAALRGRLEAYLAGDATIQAPREPRGGERPAAPEAGPLRASHWSVAALRKYVEHHPRGWKKRWELAQRLRAEGHLEEAASHLRAALGRQPRRIELWLELATTLERLGRVDEARELAWAGFRSIHDQPGRARLRALLENLC